MNLAAIHRAVLLCQDAYDDGKNISVGPHKCVIRDSGDVVEVAFRGTDGAHEWIEDAFAMPVASADFPGRIHSGFHKAFTEAWGELRASLPKPIPGTVRGLKIYGHSLGAALALLTGWHLAGALPGYALREMIVFGCPNVGDEKFVYWLNQLTATIADVVNHNDIIPALPSWWKERPGETVYLDAAGQPQTQYTDRSAEELTWADHHITEYVRRVGNLVLSS